MKIKRELKFAAFEWDDEEKSITIETMRTEEPHLVNGRIK